MKYDSKVLDAIYASGTIATPKSSLNNMYLFKADGELLTKYLDRICWACMNYDGVKGADILAVTHKYYNAGGGGSLTEEENYKFTDWLINRSQFADGFLQKDTDWCVKYQGVVIRGDLPSNYVVFLATLHRTTQEYTRIPRAWLTLCKTYSEKDALYLAHYFVETNTSGLKYAPLRSNHGAMSDAYSSRLQYENFVSGNVAFPNGNIFNVKTNYRGIDSLWSENTTSGWRSPSLDRAPSALVNPFIRIRKTKEKKDIVQDWIDTNKLGDLIKCVS